MSTGWPDQLRRLVKDADNDDELREWFGHIIARLERQGRPLHEVSAPITKREENNPLQSRVRQGASAGKPTGAQDSEEKRDFPISGRSVAASPRHLPRTSPARAQHGPPAAIPGFFTVRRVLRPVFWTAFLYFINRNNYLRYFSSGVCCGTVAPIANTRDGGMSFHPDDQLIHHHIEQYCGHFFDTATTKNQRVTELTSTQTYPHPTSILRTEIRPP
jgi:hypothetical protein